MPNHSQFSRTKLHTLLIERFSDQELRTFCFHLSETLDSRVDYDNLEGNGKDAKARELVDHFLRRNRLHDFASALQKERADIDVREALADPPGDNGGVVPFSFSEGSTTAELHTYVQQRHWKSWWIWCVIIPLVVIVVIWPFESIAHGANESYVRAFEHGELMLFSGLILLGISDQIKNVVAEGPASAKHLKNLSRIAAILVLIIFTGIRYFMIKNQCYVVLPGVNTLKSYALFSVAITVTSLAFGYYAYWRIKSGVANNKIGA
jgi:effector-associated domain 7 (EAD7)-containing protein